MSIHTGADSSPVEGPAIHPNFHRQLLRDFYFVYLQVYSTLLKGRIFHFFRVFFFSCQIFKKSRHLQPGTNQREIRQLDLESRTQRPRGYNVRGMCPTHIHKPNRTVVSLFCNVHNLVVNARTDTHSISWRQRSLHGRQGKGHSHLGGQGV